MQPKIYKKQDHGLSKDSIDPDALFVLDRLHQHGYSAYLVGGSVRDLLLGHRPKDYDISTEAKPEEVKKLFRSCLLIGRRFRLAHVRFGRKIIEVATFRAGDTDTNALIVHDNTWGTEEEDVLRRDFTINGLFYNAQEETVIDYVGGYEDLKKQQLRVIGSPHARFKQDPVRMLRLIKFRARIGFEIDPPAMQALLDCRPEILKSSHARVFEELLRMLESGHATLFIQLLADSGLLSHLLPTLADFIEKDDKHDLYRFLEAVDDECHTKNGLTKERPVLLAALVFPLFLKHILLLTEGKKKIPHLGFIQEEAQFITHEFFSPFFNVPRKIRAHLVSILTSQFRLTPLEKIRGKFFRVPRVPDFHYALSFLELRRTIEPGLEEIYEKWEEAVAGKQPKPARRRRR